MQRDEIPSPETTSTTLNNEENSSNIPINEEKTKELLKQFCEKYKIPLSEYYPSLEQQQQDDFIEKNESIRYIRLSSYLDSDSILNCLNSIEKQCGVKPLNIMNHQKVVEENNYYQIYTLPKSVTISNLDEYKKGNVFGVDISSIYCILSLEKIFMSGEEEGMSELSPLNALSSPMPSSSSLNILPNVLDVCTAPGTKSCLIYDLFKCKHSRVNTITGIDVSYHRIMTCKNIFKKYNINDIRLIYADGTRYTNLEKPMRMKRFKYIEKVKELPDNGILIYEKYGNSKRKDNEQFKQPPKNIFDQISPKYDIIIVDAECSTDGRVEHYRRNYKQIEYTLNNMDKIVDLQKRLLENAYVNCLAPYDGISNSHGVVLYCTCSFTREQNENVVQYILDKYKDDTTQQPELIHPFKDSPVLDRLDIPYVESEVLPKTIRIIPSKSQSNTCLYIALLRKHKR